MEILTLLSAEGLLDPAMLVMVIYVASREAALNNKINAVRDCVNSKIYGPGEVTPRYVLKKDCYAPRADVIFNEAFTKIRALEHKVIALEERTNK